MKLEKILIPLDGSSLAEAAIARAVALANGHHPTFVLLRAAHAFTSPIADPIEAQIAVVREAEDYLNEVKARLAEQGVKNVETSVWYGAPAESIIDAARLRQVDLIVMSSHGRSGVGRFILGSVAESVLRGTSTPILLLRPEGAPLDTPQKGEEKPKEMVYG